MTGFNTGEPIIGDTTTFELPLSGSVTVLGDIAGPETIRISISFSVEYYNLPSFWDAIGNVSSGLGPNALCRGQRFHRLQLRNATLVHQHINANLG
jgi:hypothetical protein